jgi:Spy/CpxP family protein refolding chaperone
MRRSLSSSGLACAAILAFAAGSWAQAGPQTPAGSPASTTSTGCAAMADIPGVTPAQQKQIDSLHAQTQKELSSARAELGAKRRELSELWAADTPNREAILKKLGELEGIQQRLHRAAVDRRMAFLAVLTPEQRATVRQRQTAAGQHRGMGMHGKGMHGTGMHGQECLGMDEGGLGMGDEMGFCMGCPRCTGAAAAEPPKRSAPQTGPSKPTP